MTQGLDEWAEWLVRTRFAGWSDEDVAEALANLARWRDRVLDAAQLAPGATVVDVGAGTGLLTLGAVERVGPDGDVIALDISVDALEELRANTTAPNISYLVGRADVLPLTDGSADAVLTRSVLIYVDDKAEAAREFHRVLRSGGRVSLFEPINSRNLLLSRAVDFSPLGELGDRLRAWNERFYADRSDPMLNFDESDLERFFVEAGFADVRLEFTADEDEVPADRYLNQVGAPGRPTLLENWREEFEHAEVERLVDFLAGQMIPVRHPLAFLSAARP
ncbi:MAG TPA: methyltransferase domain-containing protein [Gaiellaceae bacterium]|nr:methyltransferase domain-containing protein [Gaiellaceae bacterium]